MNTAKLANDIARNAPKIMTGLGLIGVIATGAAGVKAGQKIEKSEDKSFKTIAKYCAITFGIALGTEACFVLAYRITAERLASLAGIATASGALLAETKDAVRDIFGEDGVSSVNKAILDKHISGSDNAEEALDILQLGNNDDLFYLEWEGSHKGDRNPWFKSSVANVYAAISEAKDKFAETGYVSLCEWYDMLGLRREGPFINDIGWDYANAVQHFQEYQIKILVHECKTLEEPNRRYFLIDYSVPPESLQS